MRSFTWLACFSLSASLVLFTHSAAGLAQPRDPCLTQNPSAHICFAVHRLIVQLQPEVPLHEFEGGFALFNLDNTSPCDQVRRAASLLSHWNSEILKQAVNPQNKGLSQALGLDRYYVIEFEQSHDLDDRIQQLLALSDVFAAVEKDTVGSIHTNPDDNIPYLLPDDTHFWSQYALENTGQVIRGYAGVINADINATGAWHILRNRPGVIVAVLDSGIAQAHPDLAGQVIQGRNFTSADPQAYTDSWVSHGTHIAGIIAARTNNALGVAGLAPTSSIMPVRIVDRFGFTFEQYLADGLIWAADNGAKVVNISLGFTSANSLQRAAVQYAHALDVVICASSGNIATDPIGFPAALPETIAVGATNNRDMNAGFTSGGPEMDVAAPGRDILSTWHTNSQPNTYEYRSGTSFASPYVAATAALIRSIRPDLSANTVRAIITTTARDVEAPGWDPFTGWGRIDAHRALILAQSLPHEGQRICLADLNQDGTLDFLDILFFLQAFVAQDPIADRNNDGIFDFFDIQIYLYQFAQGCQGQSIFP